VADGGEDVGADGWVSGLRDRQVVGACCEEAGWWVEGPEGEEVVEGYGEEVG